MIKEKRINKVKLQNNTVVDLVTKTATSFADKKQAKRVFLAWTQVQDTTPNKVFAKRKRR